MTKDVMKEIGLAMLRMRAVASKIHPTTFGARNAKLELFKMIADVEELVKNELDPPKPSGHSQTDDKGKK